MHIKKGYNRFVFVFPSLGFVVKFPRIFLWWFFKSLGKCFFKGQWKWIRKQFSHPIESYGSWKRGLFKGIRDNWDEFRFYQQTKHVAVEPTYFSFFGFLNVQRYGESEKIAFDVMGKNFIQLIGAEAVMRDGHHLLHSSNFSFRGDKFRFRDYGSCKTQGIINDFGCKIFEEMSVQKLKEEQKLLKK